MGRKIATDAATPKKGMSLAELKVAVDEAVGMAAVNEKPTEECKVTIFVNFGGGIKQIVVEV